jgi:tetratricopeptide (TPR) repeat protein
MKAEAICRRVDRFRNEGKHQDAIHEGKKVLRNLSGDVELIITVAFSLIESDMSNWNEAQDLLKETLKNRPESSELHAALGICHMIHGGQDQEAYEELKRAIELNPHDDKLYSILAMVISTGFQISAYPDEALDSLRKAITLSPEYWFYYKSLGLEYWKAGRPRDAKFSFEMAQEKMTSGGAGIKENTFEKERRQLEKWIDAVERNQTYWEYNAVRGEI